MNTADITPQKFTIWSINKRFYLLAMPIACTYFLIIASRTIDTIFSSKFDVMQIESYLKFLLPFILGMIIYNHLYFFSESYGFE